MRDNFLCELDAVDEKMDGFEGDDGVSVEYYRIKEVRTYDGT